VIAAFSTSSPLVSVALIEGRSGWVWQGTEPSRAAASQACMRLLEQGLREAGRSLEEVELFAADLGPGSFTGVRVGVVIAKTLAWSVGGRCIGADAFDLISPSRAVFLPSRKNEFFLRLPGQAPVRVAELPEDAVGYGHGEPQSFPEARNFQAISGVLTPMPPEELVPAYLIEPSISTPNKPLARVQA